MFFECLKNCQDVLAEDLKKLKETLSHNIWECGQVSMQSIEDFIFSQKKHPVK